MRFANNYIILPSESFPPSVRNNRGLVNFIRFPTSPDAYAFLFHFTWIASSARF